jgi:CubicO group peptidase (beta-lactamase class C family)
MNLAPSHRSSRIESSARTRVRNCVVSFFAMGSIVAAGCEGSHPELPSIGEPATPDDTLSWMSRTAIERVLDFRVTSGARSGYVVLVARNGRVSYAYTTGWQDVEARVPMALDTRFHLASMTKPITAVAALILIEEGKLSLDDPIERFLPAFADAAVAVDRATGAGGESERHASTRSLDRSIRVRHLLTFTSGMGGYEESDDPLDVAWRERQIEAFGLGTLAARVDRIPGLPLYEEPGQRWRYGWSLDVLARIVERVAEEPYEVFLEHRIFRPLAMESTHYRDAVPADAQLAKLYTQAADGALVLDDQYEPYYGLGWSSGGGGLISTAPDYMRFALMLANGGELDGTRILEPETVAEMTRLHVASGVLADRDLDGLGFGLGVSVVADADATPMSDRDGDYWWSGLFGTHFWISPSQRNVLVVMQQNAPSPHSGLPIAPFVVQALVLP